MLIVILLSALVLSLGFIIILICFKYRNHLQNRFFFVFIPGAFCTITYYCISGISGGLLFQTASILAIFAVLMLKDTKSLKKVTDSATDSAIDSATSILINETPSLVRHITIPSIQMFLECTESVVLPGGLQVVFPDGQVIPFEIA
jgi:hypothetical protein